MKRISPSDTEAAKMPPGQWPDNKTGNNPFLKPLNKEAQVKQEEGRDSK